MALPAAFLDELRARTPLQPLIGRRVRLARSGRQWKGCCPFHGEKTPSFYVYDDHYHCFGCGAHGDAISFVMQSQGAGVHGGGGTARRRGGAGGAEAVARGGGGGAQAARPRLRCWTWRRRRFTAGCSCPKDGSARLSARAAACPTTTIRGFGLGWSGEGRGALAAALAREGVTEQQLVDAGLMRRDEETGRSYELFFNRVMFPIRDRRGRIISFGGRIMGDGQPKYVNGPETALFSKRRTLYGARSGPGGGAAAAKDLVVVEGYMDVIALHQARLRRRRRAARHRADRGAVGRTLAPLARRRCCASTATRPGARAAARAAELALPMLAPERTLKLASLPAGRGPGQPGAPRRRAGRLQAMLDAAPPAGRCAVRPAARGDGRCDHAGAARRVPRPGWRRRRGGSPTEALAAEYRSVLLDRFFASRPRARWSWPRNRAFARRSASAPAGPRVDDPRTPVRRRPPSGRAFSPRSCCAIRAAARRGARVCAASSWRAAGPAAGCDPGLGDTASNCLTSRALMSHLTQLGCRPKSSRSWPRSPVPLPACASADGHAGGGRGGLVAHLRVPATWIGCGRKSLWPSSDMRTGPDAASSAG